MSAEEESGVAIPRVVQTAYWLLVNVGCFHQVAPEDTIIKSGLLALT